MIYGRWRERLFIWVDDDDDDDDDIVGKFIQMGMGIGFDFLDETRRYLDGCKQI